MARAARLQTDLIAKDVSLSRTLQRADRSLKRFDRRMNKLSRSLRQFGGLLGVTFGAAAINNQIQYADSIGKTARQLGTSAEFLSEAAGAAKLAGVETRALTLGLQRLTRRLSEAADGGGASAAAFKELGLNAQQLERLSLDRQFTTILQALAGVQNEADRVRLAFKFFDSEGVKIARLAGNFEQLQREIRAAGGTITTEFADQAAIINDQLTVALERLNRYLRTSIAFVFQLVDGFGRLATRLVTGFDPDVANQLRLNVEAVAAELNNVNAQIDFTRQRAETGFPAAAAQVEALEARAADLAAQWKAANANLQDFLAAERQATTGAAAGSGFDLGADLGGQIADGVRNSGDEIDAAIDKAFAEAKADAITERIETAIDATDDAFIGLGDSSASVFNEIASVADQAARNMQDAFADFLFDPFKDGLRGMLDSFINTLRRMAAEAAAVKVFEKLQLGSKLFNLFGVGSGAGAGSSTGASIGTRLASAGAGLAGVTVVNNNNFTGADSGLARVMPQLLEQTREQTKAEIVGLIRSRRIAGVG